MHGFRRLGDRPLVVGHRGLRRPGVAENTPAAFAAAAAEGADAVELDARRTADGGVVVHHDALAPGGQPIVDLAAADLASVGIPALAEVMGDLPAGLGVNVELKNLPHEPDYDESERLAADVLEVLAAAAGRPLLLSSFNPYTVSALAAAHPPAEIGFVSAHTVDLATATALAAELGAAYVCPEVGSPGLDSEGIAAAHGAGFGVMAWASGHLEELLALATTGIDALCVDDPAAARARLGGRSGDDGERPGDAA